MPYLEDMFILGSNNSILEVIYISVNFIKIM